MLQSPAFGLLEAKCWPVRIDLTAVLGLQMDGSLSGLGKWLPRNTTLTCLYSCMVVHADSTNVSSCFKTQSCLPCNVGNFGQPWWLEWLKSLECTTGTVLMTPNWSMKQRCLWPVQLYTGHLLVPETLHDSISRLAVCSIPTGLWRVFADRARSMEMPRVFILCFSLRCCLVLGAAIYSWMSLVRIETMACHGVKAYCLLASLKGPPIQFITRIMNCSSHAV